MARSEIDSDPLIGELVGSYRIERVVGEGGMGRVYEAVQPAIGARVAIKVITQNLGDPEFRGRFFAEARAVNLIRHERIVNIIDLTTLPDGRPCIIMELLSGAPLEELIEHRGPLPVGSVLRLASEILDALSATHEHGIIHRDLKPANIFVSPEGHAKLVDFGIAKLGGELASHQTAAGVVVGTVPYMSPEQATGEPLDGRTDLFALGVVLYEALTGRRPFVGENVFRLADEHRQAIRRAKELRPELSTAVDALVMQALSLDPEHRFATALAMKSAVESVLEGLPRESFAGLGSGAVRALADTGAATGAEATLGTVPDAPEPTAATVLEIPRSMTSVRASLRAAPASRWPLWLALVVAVVAIVLGFGLVAGRGEFVRAGAPGAAHDAAVAEPPRVHRESLQWEAADLGDFLSRSLEAGRGIVPGAGLASVSARDVRVDGTVMGAIEVQLIAPTRSAQGACALRVTGRGGDPSVVVETLPEATCGQSIELPRCRLSRLHAIFGAAAGPVETLGAQYDASGWTLDAEEGSMTLEEGLCGASDGSGLADDVWNFDRWRAGVGDDGGLEGRGGIGCQDADCLE